MINFESRACTRCGLEKEAKFFLSKSKGRVFSRRVCNPCLQRAHYLANREKLIKNAEKNRVPYQLWTDEQKTKASAAKRIARLLGIHGYRPAKHDSHVRRWSAAMKKKAALDRQLSKPRSAHVNKWKKDRNSDYYRHLYRTDPEFNAKERLRSQIQKVRGDRFGLAKRLSYSTKRGMWAGAWNEVLDYGWEELVAHLRTTIPRGWTWNDYMDGELEIDHIRPRSSFDMKDVNQVKECWSLNNMRLMHKSNNRRRGAIPDDQWEKTLGPCRD